MTAIITKDPITIAGIELSMESQWIGSLIIFGLGSWKLYFNPLKEKVYSLDREIGEVKSDVSNLKSDVSNLKSDVSSIKEDIHLIKNKIFSA